MGMVVVAICNNNETTFIKISSHINKTIVVATFMKDLVATFMKDLNM